MEDLLCLGLILVFLSDDRAMFVIFGRFTYNNIPLGAMLRPMKKVTSAFAVTLGIPPEHELIGELLSWISFLFPFVMFNFCLYRVFSIHFDEYLKHIL